MLTLDICDPSAHIHPAGRMKPAPGGNVAVSCTEEHASSIYQQPAFEGNVPVELATGCACAATHFQHWTEETEPQGGISSNSEPEIQSRKMEVSEK